MTESVGYYRNRLVEEVTARAKAEERVKELESFVLSVAEQKESKEAAETNLAIYSGLIAYAEELLK